MCFLKQIETNIKNLHGVVIEKVHYRLGQRNQEKKHNEKFSTGCEMFNLPYGYFNGKETKPTKHTYNKDSMMDTKKATERTKAIYFHKINFVSYGLLRLCP